MVKQLLTILLSAMCFGLFAQSINSETSYVTFKIGNMGLSSVDGTFKGMKGTVIFDKNNLSTSSFDVTIDPASVDTNKAKRDTHLKEEDFFDVENYLSISFVSTQISKTSEGYLAKGDLTLLGVTKII
jgi:polyisoprenoid-binding protein YceI